MAKLMLKVDKEGYKKNSVMKFEYLNKNDRRMRFNNSQDPIYYVFNVLEQRSVPALVGDLIEDTCYEITTMIKKIVK